MGRDALRENTILAALSGPSGTVNFLVPIYLHQLGHPIHIVGLAIGIASAATLLSRIPVAHFYRPERSKPLLYATLAGGGVSFALLPFMPEMISFIIVLIFNRVFFGMATTFFLARYLDMMAEGSDRRRAMGYYAGTQAVGYTTSNALVGFLADFVSYEAAFFYGTGFAVLAIAVLFIAPELSAKPAATYADAKRPPGIRGWLHGVNDPGLWSVLNVGTWNNLFHLVLVSFYPVYAVAIGLGAAQVGLLRSLYSGINAVGRPVAGIVLERMSLRQAIYGGFIVQMASMFVLPSIEFFPIVVALFAISATARAILVVANSIGLVEEVDETRVSRAVATSAFSATFDLSSIVSPLVAGAVAGVIGIGSMFSVMAVGSMAVFVAGDLAVAQWRDRVPRAPADPA